MSGNIRVQRGELKVGPVVHESAILATKSDVLHKSEVRAAAVHECRVGLSQSSRHGLALIVGRIKYKRARAGVGDPSIGIPMLFRSKGGRARIPEARAGHGTIST